MMMSRWIGRCRRAIALPRTQSRSVAAVVRSKAAWRSPLNARSLENRSVWRLEMEKSWLLIPIAVLLFCGQGTAAEPPEVAATKEAKTWLLVVDHGRFGDSWDAAAKVFRDAVSREAWTQAVKAVRGPLGNVVSRKLKSATFVTALPGAPDGKYVVIHFVTSFERKKEAIETVTLMQEHDGAWKVSGYFIK